MVTDGLDEVWSIEHYERNDRVCWTAYRAPDGRQVLEWANDEGRGCQVDFPGARGVTLFPASMRGELDANGVPYHEAGR